jgi:hypothetical protein
VCVITVSFIDFIFGTFIKFRKNPQTINLTNSESHPPPLLYPHGSSILRVRIYSMYRNSVIIYVFLLYKEKKLKN